MSYEDCELGDMEKWERDEEERKMDEVMADSFRWEYIDGCIMTIRGQITLLRKIRGNETLICGDFIRAGFDDWKRVFDCAYEDQIALSDKERIGLIRSLRKREKTWRKLYLRITAGTRVTRETLLKVLEHYFGSMSLEYSAILLELEEDEVLNFLSTIFVSYK